MQGQIDSYPIDLPNGARVSLTVDQIGDLLEGLPQIYTDARTARAQKQAEYVSPDSLGLIPATTLETRQPDFYRWTTPDGAGVWPAGVPLLSFSEGPRRKTEFVMNTGLRSVPPTPTQHDIEDEAKWKLVFSRVLDTPIMECAWDDKVGFRKMAAALLTTKPRTLMTQLMLQLPAEARSELEVDCKEIHESSARLLELGHAMPELKVVDYRKHLSKDLSLSMASVFDPYTFRYVSLPGVVLASGDYQTSLSQVDKALSSVGLVALKGFSTQGWGDVQRLAVRRGFGKRAGKITEGTWQVLGIDTSMRPANGAPSGFSVFWFAEALVKSLGVIVTEPLDWSCWNNLKKTHNA